MKITKQLQDGRFQVTLVGQLDTLTAPQLEAELKLDGVRELAFDFAGVEYVSSAGLRVILNAQKAMNAAKGKMTIAGVTEPVERVFRLTGFAKILTFV